MTAPAGFAATSNVVSGPIANDTSTFGVAANGSIRNASFHNTRVSGDGIAANRYKTYALMAQYALSKRTILYAIVDHETATENGGLATASGDRTTASGDRTTASGDHTNTDVTAGIQLRF